MSTRTLETTLMVGDDEMSVTVEFEWSPYDPGNISGPVEACYPPEGGFEGITKITAWLVDVDGVTEPLDVDIGTLTKHQLADLADQCHEHGLAEEEDPRW